MSIKSSELRLEKTNIKRSIKCQKKGIEIGKLELNVEGIVCRNNKIYKFEYDNFSLEFEVMDEVSKREIDEFFTQGYINFSNIEFYDNKEDIFFLNMNFFYNSLIKLPLKVVLNKENEEINFENYKLTNKIYSFFGYFVTDEEVYIFSKDHYLVCERRIDVLYMKEKKKYNSEEFGIFLSKGKLEFISREEYEREKVSSLLSNKDNYFGRWEKYSEHLGNKKINEAKEVGVLEILSVEGKRIYLQRNKKVKKREENKREIEIGDIVEFSENIPEYISKNLSWGEYKEKFREENKKIKRNRVEIVVDKGKNYIEVENECSNVRRGEKLFLSIYGDIMQLVRREEARKKIVSGKAANLKLGLIINGNVDEIKGENNNGSKIPPLSILVNEKIFKHPPTPIQKEAIEIALNTPDIAIIQGPPGTGKTTVITAIIERLNELSNKRNDNKGSVLITSFQHDAVKNVIERLRVNSLPTMKYGKKDEEDDFVDNVLSKWCDEITEKIKEKNINIRESEKQIKLEKEYRNYENFPTQENAIDFLKFCQREIHDISVLEEIDVILEDYNFRNRNNIYSIENYIRNIRTTKEGFEDDGLEKNYLLGNRLKEIIGEKIKKYNEVLSYNGVIDEKYLKKLEELKRELLYKIRNRDYMGECKVDSKISNIFEKSLRQISKPTNELDKVIYDFFLDLKYNSNLIKKVATDYGFVFAATTQQSVGRTISEAKGLLISNNVEDRGLKYDTVIVDEAARVNPCDLMIPISQAKKRLILVGDHKQLPHIYDDEIMEELLEKDEEKKNYREAIEKTTFELLKEVAINLEKNDGIKRTITLDKQYRMHALLGKFVSDNFYLADGEDYDSPLGDSNFSQNLYEKPLIWKDLKYAQGNECKRGKSRVRECEAKYIVDDIVEKINTEEGKKYTFGVISFYSEQVKEIKRMLEERLGGDYYKKIRVGSVDSFQGMEFDIIYLSIVRTYEKYDGKNEKPYGFLDSPNRLCVALSRQKRVLVVVGDSDIFFKDKWAEIAKEKVPAIQKLYGLCEEEGRII